MTLRKVEQRVVQARKWAKNAGPGFRQRAAENLRQAVTEALKASCASPHQFRSRDAKAKAEVSQ